MQDRIYSLLGIATKAGRTRSGGFQTAEAIEHGTARLVILSADARGNTVREIRPKCEKRSIPLRFYGNKDDLGHAMGKELRSCVAVTDQGFADALLRLLDAAPMQRDSSQRDSSQRDNSQSDNSE